MNPMPEATELLRIIRVDDVRHYLSALHWQPVESPNPDVLRFSGPMASSGKPILAVIPVSEDFDDYPLRVWELASLLSSLEGRSANEVLRDLVRGSNADEAAPAPPVPDMAGQKTARPAPPRFPRQGETPGYRKFIDLSQFMGLGRFSGSVLDCLPTLELRSRTSAVPERLQDLILCDPNSGQEWNVPIRVLSLLFREANIR